MKPSYLFHCNTCGKEWLGFAKDAPSIRRSLSKLSSCPVGHHPAYPTLLQHVSWKEVDVTLGPPLRP